MIGGGSPRAYHATNVVLHGAAAALVALVALGLGAPASLAAVGGVLFAMHPLAVEAAAYVSGRRDLLAGVGMLAALAFWQRALAFPALVVGCLAVAAKESALVVFAWLAAASLGGCGPQLRQARMFLLVAVSVSAGLVVLYGAEGPWIPAGGAAGLAFAGRVAAHYLAGLAGATSVALEHRELLVFLEAARAQAPAAWVLGGLALTALAALALVWTLRPRGAQESRGLPTGALLVAGTLAVLAFYGGLHEPGADRHAYPLLAVLAATLAVAGGAVTGRAPAHRPLLVFGGLLVAVWMGALAADRRDDWGDPGRLWQKAWRAAPASERAGLNYALELLEKGRAARARHVLERTIAERPGDAELHLALAAVQCGSGRPAMARLELANAWRLGAAPPRLRQLGRQCRLPEFSSVVEGT